MTASSAEEFDLKNQKSSNLIENKYAATEKIDFLHIDAEIDYYDTMTELTSTIVLDRSDAKRKTLISKNKQRIFKDEFLPSQDINSNIVTGLFSKKAFVKNDAVYNSSNHPTSSTVKDVSGNDRKILSLDIDFYASSSVDSYKNGVEITQQKHWTAGLAKISAGTKGHAYENYSYGQSDTSIISDDVYVEIEVFNPVKYVETGGDPALFTYPIVTADYNTIENYILNGIIEPFPIRPVISNFSINFPFEPRSVKGNFGNGNANVRSATDSVVSLDYFTPGIKSNAPYLDAVGVIGLKSETSNVILGPSFGYFSMDENVLLPFEDEVPPRGELLSSSYGNELSEAINQLGPLGGATYVDRKSKSATCGFVYDNASKGTDSITYGGLLH